MLQLRRSLGFLDVVLYFLIACTNLQWVATAASAGSSSLSMWVIGAVTMFLPISYVVMRLSARYPEEGGMYVWSKRAFGPFAAFMTGWTYWCSNLPYFPALLYFTAGNALFVTSGATHYANSPAFYIIFSLAGLALATMLNIFGLDSGKKLVNAGGACRLAVTLAIVALAAFALTRFGSATHFDAATMMPGADLRGLVFWSVIAFAFTGPESIPFMAGEIKDPSRTIPRGLMLAAPAIAFVYIAGTVAVLVLLASAHVSGIYGMMQAIGRGAAVAGVPLLVPVCAVLVVVSCLGSVGAWLGSVARIPFVAGIDHYLPEAFGRLHPRWKSPVVALLTQAGLSAIFIIAGQSGASVKDAYAVLVGSTVLITMIPFVFLFGSAIKLGSSWKVAASACIGLFTTLSAIVLALVPAPGSSSPTLDVLKVLGATLVVLGCGAVIYAIGIRKQVKHAIEL
jgi:glutamate:GABA antiporter